MTFSYGMTVVLKRNVNLLQTFGNSVHPRDITSPSVTFVGNLIGSEVYNVIMVTKKIMKC